jgi:tetratricopeptide (TPR) repeat protein
VVAVVAEGRRATTLLLRSDVEVVVKSSRRDLLVFAQDLRTGTVAKDVELLLDLGDAGGGTRRQLTGRTDADGVLHLTSDLLAAADGVRAFAKRGGHVAFSGVDLARFQSSAPLEPRGLVFTDRPAYRPGQHVEAKALLREVRDGRFAFDAGSRWTLAVADPRGRVVRSSPLVLGDYGTLADAFDLDALAPLGTWSLRVSRTDGPTFSGSFQVQEFALERVTLDLELPRRVFYRGETVELDAVARWQHGAPVVDAPIRIALPDGQLVDLRTDSAGRAHAKFETKDQPSETALAFSATLLEQGLTTGANAFLAVREFAMELSLPRRAVLADEPFAVELATKLRDGAPIGHAATVTLLRLDEAGAEVRVTQQPLTTDEKSGAGRVDVRLAKGGRYVVRAEAVDRFGNPVSTQGTVDVSGADDAVKLRLLSDRASLEVGESTSVRLVNRAGAGLMLLTWESDTGVRWKVVNAADGTSPIEVAPDAELVPGFVLAAAAMRGTQLHTASVPFQVTRALKLTVTPRASPARPGGETTVDVLATDPLGRPVQAEVALAVVDDALLRLFADPTTAPSRVFTLPGADPKPHRTDASCTFHYDGATHEIAAAVLAEEERKRADERWAEKRVNLAARLDKLGYAQNAAPAADGPATPAIGGFALADDVEAAAEAMDAGTVPAKDGRALGGGGGRGAGGMLGHRAGPGNAARPNGFRATPEGEFAETAYFNPSIVTGPDGRASVTFKLPGQSTKYRLIARGITKETRAGETSAELVAKADLFAELVLPPRLVEGDAPRLLARVFHAPGVTGSAELRLRMVAGDRTVSMPATVDLAKGETVEFLFEPLPAVPLVENVALELVATATRGGEKVDTKYEAQLAVRPYGIEVADARSGELAASRTFFLELPAGRSFRSRQLDVVVSPSTQRFLLDEALERNPIHRRYEDASGLHELTQADVASELFGVCGVLELARTRPTAAEPADVEALRARASSLLARLIATQQQDGGWPWAGAKGSDGPTSALALGALGRARAEGLAVPADVLDLAIRYAEQAFRNAPQQGDELKAQLQYALAFFGRSDFGALNRLHRARTQLSSAALAYVCLALVVADKGPMAAEVAELIEQRAQPFAAKVAAGEGELVAGCRWDVTTNTAWNRSPLETAAVAVLALESASPKSAAIEKGVQFLLQQRPWFPARAAGMVWAALARFYGDVVPERSEAVVHVRVNDHDVQSVKLAPGLAATNVDVPDQVVGTGRVKVELALEGRARPAFLVALRGFTPDVARRELADLAVADPPLRATAPIERGRPLPTGFGVLVERPKDAWTNEVSELPLGGLADVHLTCRFGRKAGSPLERDHFVLEVPLPAGADLLDGSVHGDFLAFHERPGSLLFELGPESAYANLDFTLLGRVAGEWRVLPPAIRSSSDLDLQASGDAHTLRVLPRGVATHDAYRPTPDELFERGKRLFDAGEKKLASEPLARLLAEFGDQLRDEPFRDVARMLLFADLEAGDPRRIVRSFEVLKEKDPDFTLDFESVLKVGSAYRALEEHERALLLERAVVDETFGKDLKVAGLLASEHRFRQSFELREKLWLDYPDSPSTQQSYLALSDEMLTRAPNAHEDKELREQGLDRATLQRDGMRILMRFLAFQPDDPLAPEAGLGLVSAWLSLQDYAAASELAGKLAQRFADPRFADSFLYSKAVAEWSLGHDDVATGLLERIATVEYTDTTGHRTPSANRALAWYILGQIHHARREAAAAVACYEKVAEQFPDAREALAGIRERTLALPEVTIARPGEKAKVTLTSRNLGSAELLVYPVDLMTLCLREKNLSHIADVNLAGIAPVVKADVTLAKETGGSAPKSGESGAQPAVPAGAFVPAETSVELGLDQAGAYLVLARAEEHHASGLVLVTPLDLQVKEDASGRVRTHVLVHEGPYVRDVETKVIGSQNDAFVAGSTDPRGLFVADGIRGTATVIARHGKDEYAFWRGTTFLGPPATKSGRGAVEDTGRNVPAQQEEQDVDKSNAYFRNVLELNRDLQNKRKGDLEKEMKKNSKGVQLKQTQ